MIYLDTHVVAWLYAGIRAKFSRKIRELLEKEDLYISPAVILELQYLYETRRTSEAGDRVVQDLSRRIGLQICDRALPAVVGAAVRHKWTRDPFDRLIVAQAELERNRLVTKDQVIRKHYRHALWR